MSCQKIYGLCGLKHHIVEIRDHVTRAGRTNKQGKIVLLSQWTLDAEFRNIKYYIVSGVSNIFKDQPTAISNVLGAHIVLEQESDL